MSKLTTQIPTARTNWAKIDSQPGERPILETASAIATGQVDGPCLSSTAIVREEGAVAAHARVAAIEYRRFSKVVLVLEPVPVLRSGHYWAR